MQELDRIFDKESTRGSLLQADTSGDPKGPDSTSDPIDSCAEQDTTINLPAPITEATTSLLQCDVSVQTSQAINDDLTESGPSRKRRRYNSRFPSSDLPRRFSYRDKLGFQYFSLMQHFTSKRYSYHELNESEIKAVCEKVGITMNAINVKDIQSRFKSFWKNGRRQELVKRSKVSSFIIALASATGEKTPAPLATARAQQTKPHLPRPRRGRRPRRRPVIRGGGRRPPTTRPNKRPSRKKFSTKVEN
ncbi:hypothetical protein ACHWQZ_G014740 [Mnemiopsis leidyi]